MPTTIRRSSLLTAAIAVVVVACAVLHGGARAQAPAPAPTPEGFDCMELFLNMTSCLSYVEAGSNATVPDKECCPALAGLYDTNPTCLCILLAGGAGRFGITIDNNRALKLPSICHIDALPVSVCSEIGIPVPSPTAPSPSPSGSGPQLPGSTPSPGGAGSTTTAPPPQNRAAGRGAAADVLLLAGLSSVIVAVVGIF